MTHLFHDKLFVFIGSPARCTRQTARDALTAVGGITDEKITAFTDYVVACNRAEGTQVYQKALEYDRSGLLTILTEEQFFDILEGKTAPPEKREPANKVAVIPGNDPKGEVREMGRIKQYILDRKQINQLARHGIPTPDGGRVKADLRSLDKARRVAELINEESGQPAYDKVNLPDRCDDCGKPAKVHIGDGQGGEIAKLCIGCHNKLMAALTGAEIPDVVPERLAFKNGDGEVREFEIEFMIYQNGKTLTATEIGETKLKTDVYAELDDDFDEMLETLTNRIERLLSVKYMGDDGYFEGDKAVGYIEYNRDRDACDIIIDGKPYTWAELEKNISAREGWKIKIEFGDIGDDLDDEE